MFRFTRLLPALLAASAVACSDAPTAPQQRQNAPLTLDLQSSVSASHAVPGFYLLVPTVSPPPPTFAGVFDATLSPVIHICTLSSDDPQSPAQCTGATVATLDMSSPPPQKVTLDAKNENYNANWTADVKIGTRFRAFVSAGGRVLGYASLQGVKKQKDVVSSGFVAAVVGKPFLFKFRIEKGIAASIVVTPATATLRDVDTPDQSQLFTATVLDLHAAPLANATVDWSASNAALVSLSPTSATTSGTGQTTSMASTIDRVSASTDVEVSAFVQGLSATAVLTVLPSAGRPIAVPDAYGVVEGQSLVVAASGVLGNDLDLDGDPLTVAAVTDAVDHGTLVLQADGSFTYTPEAGYIGADAFSYTAVDPSAQTSIPATVTIQVIAASDLGPMANDDQFAVVAGRALTIAAPGFLTNDADPAGEAITATLVTSGVTNGSLSAFPDGSFTYTPSAAYTGTDAFSYRMRDASGNTADATVTITVLDDPDKSPVAVADVYSVMEGTTLSKSAPGFLGNDADPDGAPISATLIIDGVNHGGLSAFPDGSFSYTPTPGYVGPDDFTYRMRDAEGNTADAVVSIEVLPASTTNTIANPDSYVAFDGMVLQVPATGFLSNDLDPGGEALTATLIIDGVDHGALSAYPDGSFIYTPTPGYTGPDAFTYSMRDASFNTASATVTIQVLADPDEKPVGLADAFTAFAGQTLNVPASGFLLNDIDPDGSPVTATIITDGVDNGSLSAYPDGSFIYTPNANFIGTDAFEYRMRDDAFNQSDPVLVTIEVRPDPNQPPVGIPDYYATLGGTALSIGAPGFLSNDVDPEGEALVATILTDGADHGTVSAYPDGSFIYTPAAGYVGTDAFSYKMRDASFKASLETTVTIEVLDPALAAMTVVAERVETSVASSASRAMSASVGGSLEPLRIGHELSASAIQDAIQDAKQGSSRSESELAVTRAPRTGPSLTGAAPLRRGTAVLRAPAPRYHIDPATFSNGKVPLAVARGGQR